MDHFCHFKQLTQVSDIIDLTIDKKAKLSVLNILPKDGNIANIYGINKKGSTLLS
jgi:hypothetical protein